MDVAYSFCHSCVDVALFSVIKKMTLHSDNEMNLVLYVGLDSKLVILAWMMTMMMMMILMLLVMEY